MIELERAVEWAVDRLAADAGLAALAGGQIYSGRAAPPEAMRPYVLVHGEPGEDVLGNGGRLFHVGTLVARGVTEGWSDRLAIAIADRIDDVLERQRHQPAGDDGLLIVCQRVGLWMREYLEHGRRFKELGGRYQVAVH